MAALGSSVPQAPKPRTPGFVYTAITLVLVLVVGVVAMSQTQPPPPTIAEFAPQAVEQIEDAPVEQTSDFGSGEGGLLGDRTASLPTPAPDTTGPDREVIDVARVRRCIGDPPRQIEDPQSPPCVPYWEGDNGGATWKGVTRDTVTIAAPDGGDDELRLLQSFFNNRFEFYGRKLRVVKIETPNGSPEGQRAAAQDVDELHNAFASTDQSAASGFHYYEELARRTLLSAAHEVNFSEPWMVDRAPYIWQYPMAGDEMFRNIGRWACRRLSGNAARHSGDPVLQGQQRRFGIVLIKTFPEVPASTDPVEAELSACGEQVAERIEFSGTSPTDSAAAQNATNAVLQLKAAGVTSVICLCHITQTGNMYRAATSQGYFPEWLTSTYLVQDTNFTIRALANEPNQLASTFGLAFRPRQVPLEASPSWWAVQEADPSRPRSQEASVLLAGLNVQYRSLLLLASGIQMAGPHLTPETFAAALHRTTFPNPDHPIMAGKVGFKGGSHSMTIDAAEYWWSNTARSPYADEGSGTLCYVDGGSRHSLGTWPSGDDVFFRPPCDSGA